MDRFIAADVKSAHGSYYNLKSSMDRFIAACKPAKRLYKSQFKIQYG